jgi:amino acid permease
MAEVMGTGVLGLPAAMAKLGWMVGTASSIFFGLAAVYAALLLSRVKNELFHDAESYADLATRTCGPLFGKCTQVGILLTWASLNAYFLLGCASSLHALFPATPLAPWHWALVVALTLLGPLQLRTLHSLTSLAMASTGAVIVAIVIIICTMLASSSGSGSSSSGGSYVGGDGSAPPQHSVWLPEGSGGFLDVVEHVGSFVFAYQGHSVFLEVMREMEEPTHFPRSVYLANAVMVTVYTGTSIFAYAVYGDTVSGFLPDSLPDNGAKRVVGFLLVLHTAVSYLVLANPLHRALHQRLLPSTLDVFTPQGRLHWLMISSGQLALTVVLASAVPFFSQFQDLLGSLTGAPIVFGLPPIFFLRGWHLHGKPIGWADYVLCLLFLCVFLPVFLLLGTASSINGILRAWGYM